MALRIDCSTIISYRNLMLSILSLTLLLTGCQQNLNLSNAQTKIRDELAKETALQVKSVNCSEAVKLKAGETFKCQADTNIGQIPINATIKDDKGAFEWKHQGLMNLKAVEAGIQTGIREEMSVAVTANCGNPKYKLGKVGDKFKCQIEDAKKTKRDVRVTVKDEKGNINWELI